MSKRAMMPNLNEEIEMQKVTFDVVSRPTKDVAGVTTVSNVTFDDKGAVAETVQIGTLTTARGTGVYNAVVNKDGVPPAMRSAGTFTSRSQAGHAIQRAYFADERAAREAARADKAEQASADKASAAEARAAAKAEKAAAKAEADKAKAAEKAAKAEARAAAKAEKAAAKAAKAAETVVAEVIEKTAS
jgi:hypothetical protein